MLWICEWLKFILQNRDWLRSLSLTNMRNLDLVESAMFVFVLDDSEPRDEKEVSE